MNAPYKRSFSFAGFQNNQPAKPLPGQRVDIELDNIAREFGSLRTLIAAGGGGGGGPVLDLPMPARSIKANLKSETALAQIVTLAQLGFELGVGSGGGGLPDWSEIQNKPVFGNAAQRNVGASAGTVAAGDDPRIVGSLQATNNGSDIPNKGLFRSALGLKGAALLDVGVAGGVASYDDPRFGQGGDVSGKVDKANPLMFAPPRVTFQAPALVSSVPQSAIDQCGVLNVAHIGADLTATSSVDVLVQRALDAIATRIQNGKGGGQLLFPFGAKCKFTQGVTFAADGPLSIIGGNGYNREGARLEQWPGCTTLFDITSSAVVSGGSQLQFEMGGFDIATHVVSSRMLKLWHPKAANLHDIKAAAGNGFWSTFFDLRNVRTSVIERMYLRNDHGQTTDADWNGSAFLMTATDGSTSNNFEAIITQGWDVAVNAQTATAPTIEGTIFTGCHLGGKYGIIWNYSGPAGYIPPQLQYLNGHMNCQKSWFVCNGVAQLLVQGCTMELHEEMGFNNPGFELNNVKGFDISHIKMFTGSIAPNSRSSIVVGPGCDNGQISHITGYQGGARSAPAIQLLSGSMNCSMHHIETGTGGGPIYANAGSANIFDTLSIRKPGEVPAASGSAAYYAANVVFTGQTGQAVEDFAFALPGGRFGDRPTHAAFSLASNPEFPFLIRYNFDASTAGAAVCQLQRTDGGAIPQGGAIRISMAAFP